MFSSVCCYFCTLSLLSSDVFIPSSHSQVMTKMTALKDNCLKDVSGLFVKGSCSGAERHGVGVRAC